MNQGVRGRGMCLTPSFRPSPGKKEALNWANVSLNPSANSCIGHRVTQNVLALFWRLFFFFFFTFNTASFNTPSRSFPLAELKNADEAFVL